MGSNNIFKRIGRFFTLFTNRLYRAISHGPLGRVFGAYSETDAYFHRTALASLTHRRVNKTSPHTARRGMALAMEKSMLRRATYGFANALCRCSVRTIGVFCVVCGAYAAMIDWLIAAVWRAGAPDGFRVFLALSLLLVGGLMLVSDKSVAHVLTKGRLLGNLLHNVLGIPDDDVKHIPTQGVSMYALAVPLGMLCGTVTAITGPLYPALAFLVTVLAAIILTTPEAGVLLLLILAPFYNILPYHTFCFALGCLLSFLGYLFKLMRGTRAFRMEVQDFVVLLLLLSFFLGGISAAGGVAWRTVLLSVLLILMYFPAVNILATPNWLRRCRWGLLFSATVVALMGICQFAFSWVAAWQSPRGYSMAALGTCVRAGFATHITFGYFMVLVFPFAMHAFLRSNTRQHRVSAGFTGLAVLLASVLTWIPHVWLALLIEFIVLLLLCKRQTFPYILMALLAVPILLFSLPVQYRHAFFAFFASDSGVKGSFVAGRVFFGQGGGFFGAGAGFVRMLFGLGIDGLSRTGMLYLDASAIQGGVHLNFWWQQWFDLGIFGIMLPALLLFFLLQNCFSLLPHAAPNQSAVAPVSGIAMVAGVLVFDAFDCAWADPVAMLIFFILIAVVSANARIRRSECPVCNDTEQNATYAELEYRGKDVGRRKKALSEEVVYESEQNG